MTEEDFINLFKDKTYCDKLPGALGNLLSLNLSSNNDPTYDLFSTESSGPVCYELSWMKTRIFELLTLIFEAVEPLKSRINLCGFPLFQGVQNHILNTTIKGCISFINSPEYYKLNVDGEINDGNSTIQNCFNFLNHVASVKSLCSGLEYSIEDLLICLCLPFMTTKEKEVREGDEIISKPNIGSIQQLYHMCNQQVSIISKTSSSKKKIIASFLCNLLLNLENSVLSAFRILLSLLEYSIQSDKPEDLSLNYPNLIEFQNSLFISKLEAKSRIESCLLTLACLNKLADDNIKKMIGEFLSKHYVFLDNSLPVSKTYLCLIIAFYHESLFKLAPTQDLSDNYMRFLLETVNIKDKEADFLIEVASMTLGLLFINNSLSTSLVTYATETVRVLVGVLQEEYKPSLMSVMIAIILSYELQVLEEPDLFLDVLQLLVQKIEEGLRKTEEVDYLDYSIKSLIEICRKDYYMFLIQKELEDVMQPIIALLNEAEFSDPEDYSKHDSVLILLVPLVKYLRKLILPLASNIIASLSQALKTEDRDPEVLVHALSHIIIHLNSSPEASNNPEILQLLVNVSLQIVNQKNEQKLVFEGALLLQLIFQYNLPLTNCQIQNILDVTHKKLMKTANPLLQVQFLCVILSAFHSNFDDIQAILSKLKTINPFFDLLLQNIPNFRDFQYCRQVLTFGLSSLLNNTVFQEFKSRLPELFNALVSNLQLEQISRLRDEAPKKILVQNFVEI